jgi:uncharacterized protein YfaS (alpha-2-macroglobulin family)
MAKAEMSAAQLATLTHEIESRLRIGPNEVLVDGDDGRDNGALESNARTLAMALRAFLAVDPRHPLAARMARGLLAMRRDGAWRTTQEDAWALLALADYRRTQEAGGAEVTGRAYLRGTAILDTLFPMGSTQEEHVFVPAARLAEQAEADQGRGQLAFEASGGAKIFYSAELRYETAELPTKSIDEGLFVERYVRGVAPTALAEAVTAGELVVVDLLFESAEPRDQVVLDDPLPAGLEALDYDLDTVSPAKHDAETAASTGADAKRAVWLGTTYRTAPSHRQVKDDRVLTFFQHLEPGMYRVSYLARATAIGTFVAPPTRIEAMYAPEVFGRTAASVLTVRPKP